MKRDRVIMVPIRDRRQHVRILTLKNFWRALAVLVLAFVLLTVDWHRPMQSDYGRLFNTQVSAPQVTATRPVEVVAEAPVPDQTAADPMLVAPAAQEQQLGIGESANAPRTDTMAPAFKAEVAPPIAISSASNGRGVAIVGDENGVAIVKTSEASRPLLSGGIFKQ